MPIQTESRNNSDYDFILSREEISSEIVFWATLVIDVVAFSIYSLNHMLSPRQFQQDPINVGIETLYDASAMTSSTTFNRSSYSVLSTKVISF